MTLFDWLLAKKPPNTPFLIKRDFEPESTVESVEAQMKVMARLIIEAVKYHTDNNFNSVPLPDITVQLGNVHLFEYEGYSFGLTTDGQKMAVGAMFLSTRDIKNVKTNEKP